MSDEPVRFTVTGPPVGKQGRARMGPGGFPTIYFESHISEYIKRVRRAGRKAMAGRKAFDCPVRVEIEVWLAMPRSWSKLKKRQLAGHYAVKKPDNDNLEKSVWDALVGLKMGPRTYEGLVIAEDDLVVENRTTKRWAPEEGDARIEITVTPLEAVPSPLMNAALVPASDLA